MQALLFGLAFCGIGSAVTALAVALAIRSRRALQTWGRATGVVVASDFGSMASPRRNATATIEFKDHNGVTRRVATQGYREPGKEVPVLFDPTGSCEIRILSVGELWFVPAILGVLGASLLVSGICVWTGLVPVELRQ